MEFFHSFILIKCPFIATCQESCGKVMFSVTSVCSQGRGSHLTINHATFDFTVQPIPYTWYFTGQETPPPPALALRSTPLPPHHGTTFSSSLLLLTSVGYCWWPVQTCLLQDTLQFWHLLTVEACTVSTSEQYASCWNAFLCYQK